MWFIFFICSKVLILFDSNGKDFFGEDYKFIFGKDEVIWEGIVGYIVSFGDVLYCFFDVLECLRFEGIDVGLINKLIFNVIDEEMLRKVGMVFFVLVVEVFNRCIGLGSCFGFWLLECGMSFKFVYIVIYKEGCGGFWE